MAGGLPDMKAQSDVYIQLQNIYKAKARQDASEVLSTVRSTAGGENIESAEVELFCTNARFVKLINRADGDMPRLNLLVGKLWNTNCTIVLAREVTPHEVELCDEVKKKTLTIPSDGHRTRAWQ